MQFEPATEQAGMQVEVEVGPGQRGRRVQFAPHEPGAGVDLGVIELHSVLNAFQSSPGHGIFVCEGFRDGRRWFIDDYWDQVEHEAHGVAALHRAVGSFKRPLTDAARRDMHRFARVLERLAKRIDRVVTAPDAAMQEEYMAAV